MKALLTVWRLLDRKRRRQFLALQLLAVLMAFSTVGGLATILPFLTMLAEPHAIAHHPSLSFLYEHLHFASERHFVIALGIAFAAGVVLANAVNLLGSLAIDRFAFHMDDALRVALFDEYLHRPYGFHAVTSSAILTSNVLHETGRVTAGILRHGLILVTNSVAIVFLVGSVVILNPAAASVALAGLGASYAAVYALARGRLLRNGAIESREYVQRTRIVGETFGAIKELILLQAQQPFVAKFRLCCRSISATMVSSLAILQTPRHVLECITAVVLVAVALYSSGGEGGAAPWMAQMGFMGLAVYRLLPALQQAFLAVVRIRSDRHALESIGGDLRLARRRAEASPPSPSPSPSPSHDGMSRHDTEPREIRVRNVTFRHAEDRPPAIANLELRIPAGAMVGFVGANGSGKTTLIDLIGGLLVPTSGQLQADGVAIDDANRGAWQRGIAYVPQQIFLFDCTVAENIALGIPAEEIDRERVRAAVKLVRLDACVDALPQGYEQPLGERGARLSGGQRQRLGIARALYRNAPVLIMDEATSSLDGDAELEIIDALAAQRRGRTILLVAHRLSSLRHCDVVYELDRGRIVRGGSWEELTGNMPAQRAHVR